MQNDLPAAAHRLRGHHLVDALLILLGQDGQLACLLVLERLEDDLVLGFGRHLRLVVPQCLVLLGLHLARVLELLLDLQLQHLQTPKKNGQAGGGAFLGVGVVGGAGAVGHLAALVAVDLRSKIMAKWQNKNRFLFQVSSRFISYILLASFFYFFFNLK